MEPEDYVRLGKRGILELLHVEHAAAWREIEAKLADASWPGLGYPIDPHHLTTARQQLMTAGKIDDTAATATRGGRPISIVYPTDTRRRATAIENAAREDASYRRQGHADPRSRATQRLALSKGVSPGGDSGRAELSSPPICPPPSRIVVGEVRAEECLDLLLALNSGLPGMVDQRPPVMVGQ